MPSEGLSETMAFYDYIKDDMTECEPLWRTAKELSGTPTK